VVDATRGEFAAAGKGRIQELRSAFPDLATTIHPIVAEGDWVAHRMVHTGTHLAPFRGIPPTGHRVEFTSIAMNRFHEGIVVENWGLHDIPKNTAQAKPNRRGRLRLPNCPRTSLHEGGRDFRIVLADDAISEVYDRARDDLLKG
jgi:predicted ester cyclase